MKNKSYIGRLSPREITVFAMLGAIMFIGDVLMEWAPNVHPVTVLAVVYTLAYRKKGIIPIALYIALQAVFFGGLWLVPYCYIFPLYWAIVLCLPTGMSQRKAQIVYSAVCFLFGLAFGTLYAPWQVLVFMKKFSLERILAWIAAGLPYDFVHAVGNLAASFLIFPLVKLLTRLSHTGR